MYESFFGLSQRPFPAAPVARRYFPGTSIDAARTQLTRCLQRGEGPALVVGGPGLGKTLLLLVVAEQLQEQFPVALLTCGLIRSRKELLQTLLDAVGEDDLLGEEADLRLRLTRKLARDERFQQGLLLLVDEAHTLQPGLLDELRMLTNLAREGEPVVRLVLAGTMRLEELLSLPELESLNQRLALRCYLESFDKAETADYVRFELAVSGGQAEHVFQSDAYEAIFQATDGVPRLINQVCDHALLLAQARGIKPVPAALVQEAWAQLQQLPTPWTEPQAPCGGENASAAAVIEFGSLEDEPPPPADEPTAETEPAQENATAEEHTGSGEATSSGEAASVGKIASETEPAPADASGAESPGAEAASGTDSQPATLSQPQDAPAGEASEVTESSEVTEPPVAESPVDETTGEETAETTAAETMGVENPAGEATAAEIQPATGSLTEEASAEETPATLEAAPEEEAAHDEPHPEEPTTAETPPAFARGSLDIKLTLEQIDQTWQQLLADSGPETDSQPDEAAAELSSEPAAAAGEPAPAAETHTPAQHQPEGTSPMPETEPAASNETAKTAPGDETTGSFEEELIEDLYAALDARRSWHGGGSAPRQPDTSAQDQTAAEQAPEPATPAEASAPEAAAPQAESPNATEERAQLLVHQQGEQVQVVVDPYANLTSEEAVAEDGKRPEPPNAQEVSPAQDELPQVKVPLSQALRQTAAPVGQDPPATHSPQAAGPSGGQGQEAAPSSPEQQQQVLEPVSSELPELELGSSGIVLIDEEEEDEETAALDVWPIPKNQLADAFERLQGNTESEPS